MHVTARPNASRRTKTRLFWVTDSHDIVKWSNSCSCLGGRRAALFKGGEDDWLGWLPWDEIVVDGVDFGDAF